MREKPTKKELAEMTRGNRHYHKNKDTILAGKQRTYYINRLEDNVFGAEEVEWLIDNYASMENISFKKACKIAKVKGMDFIESEVKSAQESNEHDRLCED